MCGGLSDENRACHPTDSPDSWPITASTRFVRRLPNPVEGLEPAIRPECEAPPFGRGDSFESQTFACYSESQIVARILTVSVGVTSKIRLPTLHKISQNARYDKKEGKRW